MQETVYKVVKDAAATTDEEKYEALTYGYETDHTPDKRNSKVQLPFNVEQNFAYDGLGRTKEISLTDNLVKDIYYAKYGDHATNRVNSVWYGINGIRKDNVKYTYDKAGNIATVTENGVVTRYVYDGLNRLIREDNPTFGKVTYEYDNAGNILCKTVKGKQYRYTYPQNCWKDQLLERSYREYDGTEVIERFQYDSLGNPTVYRNKSLTWQGRRLMSHDTDNGIVKFTYDVTGIRTSKEFDEVTTKYIYDGNNLIAEQRGNNWIYYIYGVDGVAGFNYQDKTYLYRKNVQGDVTHIYKKEKDKTLTLVAQYVYDAWGNWEIVLNNADDIANLNPFRYRSYYFDVETGLYYLQTRYYDPELGRFISADSIEYLDPETLGGLNLYAYCNSNPAMAIDSDGTLPEWLKWLSIGLAVVGILLVAAAITILTAGVGTAIMTTTMAGAVLHGAAVGTLIGAGIGVVAGGIIGGATTNWSLEGILIGMGIGFGGGAIIGAVVGASVGALQYTNAVSQWGSAGGRTAQENMIKHFNKHVVEEGHRYLGKNVIQYTRNARKFFKANKAVMELTKSGNYVIRALFAGHNAGGFFSYTGLIFSFF